MPSTFARPVSGPPAQAARTGDASPSAWMERLPGLVLAIIGLAIASYLTAFQLGFLGGVWDPIFGDGSRHVLHSFISRLLPFPDAALGAAGYAAEIILGLIGGSERWRRHPRVTLLYGACTVAVAVAGIGLALVQLFILQAGCTLCLCSTVVSIVIAVLARAEFVAALSHLRTTENRS